MNTDFSNSPQTVNLSKDQVEAIIRQEIGRSFPNFVAEGISFKVSTQTDMQHEVSGPIFEGVDIVLKPWFFEFF